jgi:hypothetical protein
MIFERTSRPSAITAAAVSSHDVSMPRTSTTRLLNVQMYRDIQHDGRIPPELAQLAYRLAALLLVVRK